MTPIKFGTDGWRAVIGEDYTPSSVARVIQAFCDLYGEDPDRTVFIGFDRRRLSEDMAKLTAAILAHNGFKPQLSSRFCPTPCVSWLVKTNKALAGIVITASHNPPQWNGVKFKESYGGAASPEYTGRIEKRIAENWNNPLSPYPSWDELVRGGKITVFDPATTYVKHLRDFIDVKAIRESGFKIAVDPLFGAGAGYIQEVLQTDVLEIHGEADPDFGGLNPEPIEKNLRAFADHVVKTKADVGLATDGDADRIGAIDENGEYVNSHQIFALLLKHYVTHRKLTGTVVNSVSTSAWIARMCEKYGLKLIETPIGFKHISAKLKENDALMGGEESGGISLREHVHERDGVLNGLMLAEMMAIHRKRLSGLLADLYAEFGRFYFHRDDYHLSRERIEVLEKTLSAKPVAEVGGRKVIRYNTLDGVKIIFDDDSWLLLRASGTEPLLRAYAEALSRARVEELLTFAREKFGLGS